MTEVPTYELNDGRQIPAVGFGTYPLRGGAGLEAIGSAIDAGYRLIDSAFNYDNEGTVGRALALSGVPREELFITSKLPGRYHERPASDEAIAESLWRLGLDYIDLYLIHWPNPSVGKFVPAWQALVAAQEAGLVRSIGVSNFTTDFIEQLVADSGVAPATCQVEIHPYWPQVELVAALQSRGIRVEAWSPLGKRSRPIDDPVVKEIAAEVGREPGQVILRWHVQRGIIPIPKSVSPTRQRQNLQIFDFELSAEQVQRITDLGRSEGMLFDGDPRTHVEL